VSHDNNCIIADFMGEPYDNTGVHGDVKNYDTSWNALMPVIKKIIHENEHGPYSVKLKQIRFLLPSIDIDSIYGGVLNFIINERPK